MFVFRQQQQLAAIDNSRTLITSLLSQMAALSSAAPTGVHRGDAQMTPCHSDAAVSSQRGCSRASSSSSSSSERHTTSSADSGLAVKQNGPVTSLNVINDVMNVTSEQDNHAAFTSALVAFVKVYSSFIYLFIHSFIHSYS